MGFKHPEVTTPSMMILMVVLTLMTVPTLIPTTTMMMMAMKITMMTIMMMMMQKAKPENPEPKFKTPHLYDSTPSASAASCLNQERNS